MSQRVLSESETVDMAWTHGENGLAPYGQKGVDGGFK